MKPITITISEELDIQAAAEAKRRGISKSELIRVSLEQIVPAEVSQAIDDPWRDLAGFASEQVQSEPGEIDRVVYGS